MGRPARLVLATANRDKAGEIAMMLPGIELLPRPEAVGEVDETEDTLEGNARLKARAVAAVAGEPAVADDTGLEVDALDGRPGVFAARYAGEGATYADNVAKLLAELAGLAAGASSALGRRARFRTVALVAWPDGREMAAHGVVEGHIALEPRGAGGFGYDPVFVPDDGDGRTFAEMAPEEKAAVSHRARAFAALHRLLATASGSTAVAAAGTSERPGVLGCGDRVDTLAGRGPLAVTGSFPSKVDGAGDGTFSGKVTVTSIAERVSGVASAEADVFVTRTGKVVVTPLAKDSIAVPVDLAPGTSQAFGARGGIRQCPGGDAGGGQPLAAGRYDIYAVVVVLDDSGRGTGVVATGGPWPLEVS